MCSRISSTVRVRGDQLVLGRRGRCRRSTGRSTGGDEMRTCTSAAPASNSICDDLARRVAADDRVVDDDDALARDLGERVELQPDALLAQPLVGLDERAADVAVLDQALAERDAGRAREADRGRRARVGDRQDEVGLDRRLRGEPLAHPHARAVHLDAVEPRVGAGEVEELEDAERAVRRPARRPGARARRPRRSTTQLAAARPRARARRRRGRARTSRRRRPSRRPSRPSTSGRKPCGSRKRDELPLGERDHRVARPRAAPSRSATASSSGAGSFAISAAISSRVGGRRERDAVGRELVAQLASR